FEVRVTGQTPALQDCAALRVHRDQIPLVADDQQLLTDAMEHRTARLPGWSGVRGTAGGGVLQEARRMHRRALRNEVAERREPRRQQRERHDETCREAAGLALV